MRRGRSGSDTKIVLQSLCRGGRWVLVALSETVEVIMSGTAIRWTTTVVRLPDEHSFYRFSVHLGELGWILNEQTCRRNAALLQPDTAIWSGVENQRLFSSWEYRPL